MPAERGETITTNLHNKSNFPFFRRRSTNKTGANNARIQKEELLTIADSPMAATVDDPFSFCVNQISPMSNPKPAHATCKYARTLSGSMMVADPIGRQLFSFIMARFNKTVVERVSCERQQDLTTACRRWRFLSGLIQTHIIRRICCTWQRGYLLVVSSTPKSSKYAELL